MIPKIARWATCLVASLMLVSPDTHAQTRATPASTRQAFDVASIKLDNDKVPTATRVLPAGISYTAVTVRMLIADAYGVSAVSITSPDARIGDALDDRQRYDIEAKSDHAVSKAQVQLMLQSLLTDRFKLSLHHDAKVESIYRLTTLPSGAKLTDSVSEGNGVCNPGPEGGAVCTHMTMAAFADYLTNRMARVVVDETKLTGRYDFTLKLTGTPGVNDLRAAIASSADPGATKASMGAAMNDWTGSSILADIQKQLGLKLESDKGPVDHLVIDHVEKPSPNGPAAHVNNDLGGRFYEL